MPFTEEHVRPVDTIRNEDRNGVHAFCAHRQLTWCGEDSGTHEEVPVPDSPDRMCRICLLGVEMYVQGNPCPVCGCWSCVI